MDKNGILDMIHEVSNLIDNPTKSFVNNRLNQTLSAYEDSLNQSMEYLLTKNSKTVLRKLNTLERKMEKDDKHN